MIQLRDYQQDIHTRIHAAWAGGAANVMAVLPCGAGKTVLFTQIAMENRGHTVIIAHRQELVLQISLTLCAHGGLHNLIVPGPVKQMIIMRQIEKFGQGFDHPAATVHVASVDTLIRRKYPWFEDVTLWIQDEGHHILKGNKWGRAASLFPNARGLAVTATPTRSDKKGLGRQTHGLMDEIVVGVGMRELIDRGYLTDFVIYGAAAAGFNRAALAVGRNGEFTPGSVKKALGHPEIAGDVVKHYLRHGAGRLGVTFSTGIEMSNRLCSAFVDRGVPAAVVSYETPLLKRAEIMERFANREIMQLINVDIVGEGFDLPAIEVVSFARPTASYGLYVQQFGRALRPMEGKDRAVIIDHVHNVFDHGLPERDRVWSLAPTEKRTRAISIVNPFRTCEFCSAVYERFLDVCPECHQPPTRAKRNDPDLVDGDLTELTPEILYTLGARVRRENNLYLDIERWRQRGVKKVWMGPKIRAKKRLINTRRVLLRAMQQWAGLEKQNGLSRKQRYKKFYVDFGVDVMTSQVLDEKETLRLLAAVNQEIDNKINSLNRKM